MEVILLSRFPARSFISDASLRASALPAVFALVGLLLGSWASRIPEIQGRLQMSHSVLSIVLLCGGLGGVLAPPLAALLMRRLGARSAVLYAGLVLCVALPAIGLASDVAMLMPAVLLLGLSAGCAGIGMNAVAAQVETAGGKARMAMLHACGCAGSLAGALIGSAVAGSGVEPASHFIRTALPVALLLWSSCQLLEADRQGTSARQPKFALPGARLVWLGVLGFCAVLAESSVVVWSGLFLKEQFGVGAGFAPLALSAFTVTMLLARLVGDKLKDRHGARRLLMAGAGLSAAGLFLAVLAPNPCLALAGFACSGLGLALAFPLVVSAVGQEGPLALTVVLTITNLNGLIGPPVVGTIADHFGMQATIGFIGVISVAMALVAARPALLK
jgi:MFS family permease